MTIEECIALLKRYAEYDGIGIPNLAGCKEAMRMAAELLKRHPLPSNLDEAAEKCAIREGYLAGLHYETMKRVFKAGAELMALQFEKIEGKFVDWYETQGVDYCCGIKTNESFEVPEAFYIKKK